MTPPSPPPLSPEQPMSDHLPPRDEDSLSSLDLWLAGEETTEQAPDRFSRLRALRILIRQYRESAERERRLRELIRKAAQLADRATDWNLPEAEIDGEMVSVYELAREFRAAASIRAAASGGDDERNRT